MADGKVKIVALLGETGQLLVRAEIVWIRLDGLGPPVEPFPQGPVHIFKRLFSRGLGGGIARPANPVEDAACFRLLARFMGEKSKFERGVVIGRVESHDLGELVARGLGFTDLEIGVGEVLANGRSRQITLEDGVARS
jgi:hypothetical protein